MRLARSNGVAEEGPPLSAPRRSVRIRPTSSCRGKSLYKTQPARIADIAFPALKTSQPRRYASETTLPPEEIRDDFHRIVYAATAEAAAAAYAAFERAWTKRCPGS